MSRMICGCSATAAILFASAAFAQAQPAKTSAVATVDTAHKADPGKLVCRTVVPTGSRLGGKRICLSRLDWEARRRQDADWLDSASRVHRLDGQY